MTNISMICYQQDGAEIARREVPRCKRFSLQAVSDRLAAEKAKVELGETLHHVSFGYVTLHFDNKGRATKEG